MYVFFAQVCVCVIESWAESVHIKTAFVMVIIKFVLLVHWYRDMLLHWCVFASL